jgi:hypothetical protein
MHLGLKMNPRHMSYVMYYLSPNVWQTECLIYVYQLYYKSNLT